MSRLASAVVAIMVASIGSAATRGQVFKVSVDGVAVDVLVTRGGRPVPGLTRNDFVLRDNGIEQRIESVMLEDVPITLLLVLDVSGSVQGDLLTQLRGAARAAAAALRPIDRLGLVTFSHRVQLQIPPPAPASALASYMETLEAAGDTSMYDATLAVLALRQRSPGRTLVLIFSDGEDTASWLDPRDVISAAQRSDVVLHAIVAGPFYDPKRDHDRQAAAQRLFDTEPHLFGEAYLPRLVKETGGSLHHAGAAELKNTFVGVIDEFRSRYVLTYVPQNVPPKGWHELDVKVTRGGMDVQARRGYLR